MPYHEAKRESGQARKPQVRKVVDANGKKWLVREAASSTPRRPAQGSRSPQPPPVYRQEGSRQGERAGSAYEQRPSRRGSRATQAPQQQVSHSQRRSHHQEGSRRGEGSGSAAGSARRPYSEGAARYHSQQQREDEEAVARVAAAAERAKRQKKKEKYIKWLMYFVS